MSAEAVQRYGKRYSKSLHEHVLVPVEDGDWVRAEDHERALSALTADVARLRAELDRTRIDRDDARAALAARGPHDAT